jgi:hypothetical protein
VFELAASTYDRVRNRRLAIVNISKSLASVAGAKRFAGLAPMGEMRRMVEGDDTVVWKPWLVGKWLGPGEGGEDLPRTLPETASDEEKEALKKRLEKEELDKVKLPQVMFATINHVFKVGDSWKMRGGKPGLPPVMEHAEAVGKQCYVLGPADVRGGGVEGVPKAASRGGGAVDAPAVPAGRGVPLPGVRVLPREQPRARR